MPGYKRMLSSSSVDELGRRKPRSQTETYPLDSMEESSGMSASYGSIVIQHLPGQENDDRGYLCCPLWFKGEFAILFNLAWTMVIATILTNLLAPIGLMFAGHLGIEELGGVALGNTILNIFGNAVGIGLSTACDTYFAQTYGSGNRKQVGIYLQRGCYIILLFAFPCWTILINTEIILVTLGQDPIIANISAEYILHYMPVIPVIFLYHIFSKYLRNQNIIIPTLIASGFGVATTALAAYVFINVLDLGVRGCAYAQMCGFVIFSGGCIGYSFSSKCEECWDGFTWEALQDWGSFTNLAMYGMFLVLEQIGAFEVGTILAGLFGTVALGAQTILFQIETITFMIPIGVGIACNIRIGHLLGANDPVQTRRSIKVGWMIIWTTNVVTAILLGTLRYQIPRLFTNDDAVIDMSADLLLIMALYAVFEGTVGTSGGMMRGCGKQRLAAFIAFIGYFILGLPIGIVLMFYTELKVAGFWWGLTIGIVTQAIFFVIVLLCTNWEKEASAAQVRAGVARQISPASGKVPYEETEDEIVSLLSNGTSSHQSSREDSFTSSKKYCGEFVSSLPSIPPTKTPRKLTKKEMICRRGFVVLMAVLTLAAGIVVRFTFPPAPVHLTPSVVTNSTTMAP